MLRGKQIDFIPHTGIAVFGKEHSTQRTLPRSRPLLLMLLKLLKVFAPGGDQCLYRDLEASLLDGLSSGQSLLHGRI